MLIDDLFCLWGSILLAQIEQHSKLIFPLLFYGHWIFSKTVFVLYITLPNCAKHGIKAYYIGNLVHWRQVSYPLFLCTLARNNVLHMTNDLLINTPAVSCNYFRILPILSQAQLWTVNLDPHLDKVLIIRESLDHIPTPHPTHFT